MSEWIGLVIACVVVAAVAGLTTSSPRLSRQLATLLLIALVLRFVGAILRYEVLARAYGGVGDAMEYFEDGFAYSREFWRFDFSAIFDSSRWRLQGSWWGTTFVAWPTGFVLMLVGESMRGGFVIFSLLSFAGLAAFVAAFSQSFRKVRPERYARWIWLFPSLWFWPSSIGKDALILCGLGIFIWGFVDSQSSNKQAVRGWVSMVAGGALVFAVRPQMAAVIVASAIGSVWLSTLDGKRKTKWLEACGVLAVGAVVMYLALGQLGISGFDAEGVGEYLDTNANRGDYGGSGFSSGVETGGGLLNLPIAFFNILFRPLPWEAHNIPSLISGVEIWGFWTLAFLNRKRIWKALKHCRKSRLMRFAIIFVPLYAILLGLLIANAGIIARQRIFLFPLLFLFFEGVPKRKKRKRKEELAEVEPESDMQAKFPQREPELVAFQGVQ